MRFTLIQKFSIVLFIVLTRLLYCSYEVKKAPEFQLGLFSHRTGDTPSYILPIKNYQSEGIYYWDNGKEKIYSGRLPHYGSIFGFFSIFLNENSSYDAVVILQIILESIAILLCSLLCFELTKKKSAFWICLIIMTVSLNVGHFNGAIFTDSLANSLLVIFLFYFSKFLLKSSFSDLLYSSIFLSLTTALKSYWGVLYIFVGIIFLIKIFKGELTFIHGTKYVAIFSLMLLLVLGPWIIRNYVVHKKFIPLQESVYAGYNYSNSELRLRDFISAFGGNFIHWEPGSAGAFFLQDASSRFYIPHYDFPNYVLQVASFQHLDSIKGEMLSLKSTYSPKKDSLLSCEILKLTQDLKQSHFIETHILNKMLLVKQFIFHSGSYYLPISLSEGNWGEKLLKLFQSFLYYFTLFFGFWGLFQVRNSYIKILLLSIPLLLILGFPIIWQNIEIRYWHSSYPVLAMGTSILASKIHIPIRMLRLSLGQTEGV